MNSTDRPSEAGTRDITLTTVANPRRTRVDADPSIVQLPERD